MRNLKINGFSENRKVKVVRGKENMGKVYRVNQVLKIYKSEVLVQVDGDITLKNEDVISNLVKRTRQPAG